MGSGSTDYSQQVNNALGQSNLPKAPISQSYSNLLGNAAPGLMNALMNVQSLGNSFINSNANGGGYKPQTANPNGSFAPAIPNGGNYPGPYGGNVPGSPGYPVGLYPGDGQTSPANEGNNSTVSSAGGATAAPVYAKYQPGSGTVNIDAKTGLVTNAQGGVTPVKDYLQQMVDAGSAHNLDEASQQLLGGVTTGIDWAGDGATKYQPGRQPFNIDQYLASSGYQAPGNSTGASGLPVSGVDPTTGLPTGANRPIPGSDPTATPILNPIPANPGVNQTPGLGPDGNPLPSGPGVSNPGGGSSYMGGSVNTDANGNPNGINIPNLMQAFAGNPQQAMSQLSSIIAQLSGGANSGALKTAGQTGGADLNTSNVTSPLNTALATGKGPTDVSGALAGVPNSLALTPENSQYMDAVTKILQGQNDKNVADTRERALDTGTARSTGASYDEAQLKAAQAPQLAAALQSIRQGEVGNQLQQAGQQQAGILGNQTGNNNALSTLTGAQQGQNSNILQNFYQAIQALQGQQGLALGGSQGLAGLSSGIDQSNASQGNAFNLAEGSLNQNSAQTQIQNQLQQLAMLFGGGLSLAGAGIPGGSANVNLGANGTNPNSIGSTLGGLGTLLGAFGGL